MIETRLGYRLGTKDRFMFVDLRGQHVEEYAAKVGDWVALPCGGEIHKRNTLKTNLDPTSVAQLWGAVVLATADSPLDRTVKESFLRVRGNLESVHKLSEAAERAGHKHHITLGDADKLWSYLDIFSRDFVADLYKLGFYKIPTNLLSYGEEVVAGFIQGLFWAQRHPGEMRFSSTDRVFIQKVLLRLGIPSRNNRRGFCIVTQRGFERAEELSLFPRHIQKDSEDIVPQPYHRMYKAYFAEKLRAGFDGSAEFRPYFPGSNALLTWDKLDLLCRYKAVRQSFKDVLKHRYFYDQIVKRTFVR